MEQSARDFEYRYRNLKGDFKDLKKSFNEHEEKQKLKEEKIKQNRSLVDVYRSSQEMNHGDLSQPIYKSKIQNHQKNQFGEDQTKIQVSTICSGCIQREVKKELKKNQKKKDFSENDNVFDLNELSRQQEDTTNNFLYYHQKKQLGLQKILKKSKNLDKNIKESTKVMSTSYPLDQERQSKKISFEEKPAQNILSVQSKKNDDIFQKNMTEDYKATSPKKQNKFDNLDKLEDTEKKSDSLIAVDSKKNIPEDKKETVNQSSLFQNKVENKQDQFKPLVFAQQKQDKPISSLFNQNNQSTEKIGSGDLSKQTLFPSNNLNDNIYFGNNNEKKEENKQEKQEEKKEEEKKEVKVPTPSLFGNTQNTQSLFQGSPQIEKPKSLFGNPSQVTQPAPSLQQNQPLFGSGQTENKSPFGNAPTETKLLFGKPQQQNKDDPRTLFGNSSLPQHSNPFQNSAQTQGKNLFGNTEQSQQKNLFGNPDFKTTGFGNGQTTNNPMQLNQSPQQNLENPFITKKSSPQNQSQTLSNMANNVKSTIFSNSPSNNQGALLFGNNRPSQQDNKFFQNSQN